MLFAAAHIPILHNAHVRYIHVHVYSTVHRVQLSVIHIKTNVNLESC